LQQESYSAQQQPYQIVQQDNYQQVQQQPDPSIEFVNPSFEEVLQHSQHQQTTESPPDPNLETNMAFADDFFRPRFNQMSI
jgi:hypothetical protein